MGEVNILGEFNNIVDNGSNLVISPVSLRALIDNNVTEDAVLLEFSTQEVLNVRAELGSRYLVKEIRVYTSAVSPLGLSVSISQDNITYTPLEGEIVGSYVKFPVNAPVQYVIVIQDATDVQHISPRITKISGTTVDSSGSSLFGSSTINSITVNKNTSLTKRFNTGSSWFNEPFSANLRGKKREFPENYLLACTSTSLDIIDVSTLELWMRFNTGASTMLGSVQPVKAVASDTKIYVILQNTAILVIDFYLDRATKYTASGDYQSNTTILNRHSTATYSERNITTYTNNILSNSINDIYVLGNNDLYDIASVATDAGLSLIIGNYAVTSCTEGTLPVVKTAIASNRKVYWGGFDGLDGDISYLDDALSVIPNASLATTFSRDGYYSTATTPALGAINIRDIVAI
jgi:hypothetical protein